MRSRTARSVRALGGGGRGRRTQPGTQFVREALQLLFQDMVSGVKAVRVFVVACRLQVFRSLGDAGGKNAHLALELVGESLNGSTIPVGNGCLNPGPVTREPCEKGLRCAAKSFLIPVQTFHGFRLVKQLVP